MNQDLITAEKSASGDYGAGDAGFSETWIDRLALEREHAEHALVDAAQWLAADEALECLDPEGEFAHGERALAAARSTPTPES